MASSYKAAYGHGFRVGRLAERCADNMAKGIPASMPRGLITPQDAPEWFYALPCPGLHAFVWRQGFREGVGRRTLISRLTSIYME